MELPELIPLVTTQAPLSRVRKLRDQVPAVRCGTGGHLNALGHPCGAWAVKGTNPPACRKHGAQLPRVREAAERRVDATIREQLEALVPKAVAALEQLITDPEDDKVRLAAAKDVLDRTGNAGAQKIEVGGPGSFNRVDDDIERLLSGGESET